MNRHRVLIDLGTFDVDGETLSDIHMGVEVEVPDGQTVADVLTPELRAALVDVGRHAIATDRATRRMLAIHGSTKPPVDVDLAQLAKVAARIDAGEIGGARDGDG